MKKSKVLVGLIVGILSLVGIVAVGCGDDESTGSKPTSTTQSEWGVYYYDYNGSEYLLTLSKGNAATVIMGNTVISGAYTRKNGDISFKYVGDGLGAMSAKINDDDSVVTLTYDSVPMPFLRRVIYDVTFDSVDGSDVAAVEVLNGKSLSKPSDPVRTGYAFLGWYKDDKYTVPFIFDSDIISANTTLYAQWGQSMRGENVYTVSFDVGDYEGAVNPNAKTTVGGKIYNLDREEPTREGYTFKGWWYSVTGKADELTYRVDADTIYNESTTLYAVWQGARDGNKLLSPAVSIKGNRVSWEPVSNAVSYRLTVTAENGDVELSRDYNTTYADLPMTQAGSYTVSVVAASGLGASYNSDPTVRTYNYNPLARVSLFSVVNSDTLLWNEVEHAERYLIDIDCGNPEHMHNPFDNGDSTYFNFSNCEMQEGGIKMTVTAVASGYTSSVSDTYVIDRSLAAVTGLRYDDQTQTISWQAVPNATNYELTLMCDTLEHSHYHLDLGAKTSYSIKECLVPEGGIDVSVTPRTKGYNSPSAALLTITAAQKVTPAAPRNLRIADNMLSWSEVPDVDKYTVRIGEYTFESTTNSLDLSALSVNWAKGADYSISVRAEKGDKSSAWSDATDARYYAMYSTLTYNRNIVSWRHVIGAKGYLVRVNGDAESLIRIENGANSARITLSRSGDNLIEVQYYTDKAESEWAPLHVTAYAVTLDTRGGAAAQGVVTTKYYAIGDEVSLPAGDDITKTGYTLGDWYNTPNSAEGKRYTEKIYSTPRDIDLYASWAPITYNVTLNYSGGGTGETTTTVTYGKPFTWPTPDTVADATMVFGGWCANSSGTAAAYTDETGKSLADWAIADDIVVYAQWKQVFDYEKHQGGSAGYYYELKKSTVAREIDTVTVPAYHKADGDPVAYPVTQLSTAAFDSCTNVRVINLPNTIDTIPAGMFKSKTTLREINVYTVDGVTKNAYWSNNGVLYYNNSTAGTVDLWTLPRDKKGVYTLPSNVTNLPADTLYHSTLTELRIPSNVTYIAYHAFYYSEIPTVTFLPAAAADAGKTLRIEEGVFEYSSKLETVTLPDRKFVLWDPEASKEIKNFDYGAQVFKSCTGITAVNVHPSNSDYQSIEGVLCTRGAQATIVYVPKNRTGRYTVPVGIVAIGDHAFTSSSIEEIVIPNWVRSIGDYAFAGFRTFDGNGKLLTYITGNSTLKKVTFAGGDGVAAALTIGKNAFGSDTSSTYACSKLATVEFQAGSNVAEIGEYAFAYCPITEITFPASLVEIKARAFYSCGSLETLTYAANGKDVTIGNNVFEKCAKLTTIVLPANITQFDDGVFSECDTLATIEVDPNNPVLKSVDGVLFSKDGKELKFYPTGREGDYQIPAGVERIGAGAFGGGGWANGKERTKIESVFVSKDVTYIGARAFANCQQLKSVTFEEGGTKELVIGNAAFNSCINLETFHLPDRVKKIPDRMLYRALKLTEVYIPDGVTEIGDYALGFISYVSSGPAKIAKITVPASVETIGVGAFYCTGVGEVEFVSEGRTKPLVFEVSDVAVTTGMIGNFWADNYHPYAMPLGASPLFAQCYVLSKVTLPDGVAEIPSYAFRSCEALVSIKIPGSVTKIGEAAFGYCKNLKNVVFEERSAMADDPTKPLPLEFAEGYYKSTGGSSTSYTFYGVFTCCYALETITLPEGLTRIPAYTFVNCKSLKSVYIPSTVQNGEYVPGETQLTAIGAYAFGGYMESSGQSSTPAPDMVLETVTFAAGGTGDFSISEYAFNNNKKLTSITLPATLADSYVAEYFLPSSLSSLGFVNGWVSGIRTGVEYSNSKNEKCISIYGSFYNCPNLAEINIMEGGKNYISVDGVVYGGGGTELAYVPTAREKDIVVPANVTLVRNFAAYGNTKVQKLTFLDPEEATADNSTTVAGLDIGKDGFRYSSSSTGPFKGTKLVEVVLPKRITSIDVDAFMNCGELTTVTIPAGANRLAKIGSSAFESDAKLTSINIPDSVTEIGSRAFYGTLALTTVTINEASALNTVGDQAFNTSGIMSIYLPPASPFNLGKEVFAKCPDLATARIPETITSFDGLFSGSNSLYLLDIYKVSGGGTTSSDGSFINDNGAIYIDGGKTLSYYPASKADEEYTVRPGTETIAAYAFNGNLSLKKLTIPNTVSQIDDRALWAMQSIQHIEFEKDDVVRYVLLTDEEKESYKGDRYNKNGEQYELSPTGDYKIMANASKLVIGSAGNTGTSVSTASDVFAYCVNLERVDFPARLEKIAAYSFYYCKKLTTVTFDSGCKLGEIYGGLFLDTALEFGGTREQIDEDPTHPFELPALISSFTYTTSNKNAFGNVKKLVIPSGVTNVGNYSFYYCESLEEVVFEGSGAVTFGNYVFEGCTNLKTVVLPSGTKTISSSMFKNCTNLEWLSTAAPTATSPKGVVTIPSNVTTIGSSAFEGCASITKVILPTSTDFKQISSSVFLKCYNLEKITSNETQPYDLYMSSNITTISSGAFAGTKITSAYLPGSITSLSTCFGSSQTTDPNGTSAGSIVLCRELKTVVFDQNACGITALPAQIFMQLPAIEEITWPKAKMTTIGAGAFAYSGIKSVTIPTNITTINKAAFAHCSKLEYVKFESSTTLLTLTAATSQSYASTSWSYSYQNVGVFAASGSNNGRAEAKAAAEAEDATQAVKDAYAANYKIDMSARKIMYTNKWTFNELTGLDVVLSNETTTISTLSFQDAELDSITVPAKTTTIQIAAFAKSKIKTIDFAAATGNATIAAGTSVTSDASLGAFAFCTELTKLDMSKSKIATVPKFTFYGTNNFEVVLSNSTTKIDQAAFMNAGIESISIPASVTTIEKGAFADCAELTTVKLEKGTTNLTFTDGTNSDIPTSITTSTVMTCGAFVGCSALTTVDMSERRVDKIGNYLFYGCEALSDIKWSVKTAAVPATEATETEPAKPAVPMVTYTATIGNYAFRSAFAPTMTTLALPEGVTTIGTWAYNDTPFTSVNFPSTLTTIGERSFTKYTARSEYSGLTGKVVIPGKVKTIGEYAFADDLITGLEFATYKDSKDADVTDLQTISKGAFYGTNIAEVELPASLVTLEHTAFYRNTLLTKVTFAEGSKLKTIGDYAFEYSLITNIEIPAAVTTIGKYAFAYTDLASVTFKKTDKGETAVTTFDEASFGYNADLTAFEIPASVTTFNSNPFMGCENLTAVKLAETTAEGDGEEQPQANFVIDSYAIYNGDMTTLLAYLSSAPEDNTFALAASVVKIGDYAFAGSKIKGVFNASANENLVISANAFEGTAVTVLTLGDNATVGDDAFYSCEQLTTVTIGKGATIGAYAFEDCSALTAVTIGESANVGAYAFEGCTSLTAVTVPAKSVVNITALNGSGVQDPSTALAQDTQLMFKDIVVSGKDVPAYAMLDQSKTVIISADSKVVTTDAKNNMIANNKYKDNKDIEYVIIEEGVERIGNNAFQNCSNLKGVILPSTLKYIGQYAFSNTGLVSIVIPKNVETVLYYAFAYNYRLTTVTFEAGSKVKYFYYSGTTKPTATNGVNTFYNCTALKSVTLPDSMEVIPYQSFYGCSSLESITIPSTVTDIYGYAFQNCTSLTTVTFDKRTATEDEPDEYSILSFGTGAFNNAGLTSFTLPYTVTTMGTNMFENCASLSSFTFGTREDGSSDLTTIASSAFKTSKLTSSAETMTGPTFTSITIPYSVTTIGTNAFENSKLTSITFAKDGDGEYGITTIGNYAFKASAFTSFTLPYTVTMIGTNAFENCKLSSFTFEKRTDGSCDLTEIGGSAFKSNKINADDETYTGPTFTTITIPYSVTTLGSNLFENGLLTSITFEKNKDGEYGITTIGGAAFKNTAITSFSLPFTVKTIGANAFESLPLTSFTFEKRTDGSCDLTEIGGSAFKANKLNEDDETYTGIKFTSISIPYTVKTIGANAFENTQLTSITFEKRADGSCDFTYTGNYAFANTELTSIALPKSYTGYSSGTNAATYVFYNCSALASVTYEEGSLLGAIGAYAFAGTAISSLAIPYNTKTIAIGNYAFNDCVNLTSVTWTKDELGRTAKSTLATGVFNGCTSLKHIVLAKTVTPNNSAFAGLGEDTVVYFDSLFSPTAEWIGKKYLDDCPVKYVWGWNESMGFMKPDGTFEGAAA